MVKNLKISWLVGYGIFMYLLIKGWDTAWLDKWANHG